MQVQRLREHIDKKHTEAADIDGSATAQASADTKEAAESSAQQTLQAGSKASQQFCHFSHFFRDAGCAVCPSHMPMQGKTMDVGAKAGFYTEKSPKMLLQEWCMQKKRPTPRYKITAGDEREQITKAKVSSCFSLYLKLACHIASRTAVCADAELLACGQVVMADPKDRDKDVVVFLGTEHQTANIEEAGQRLAVTALHRVNGDRALHRVLPEQYRSLWHHLGEQVGSLTLMQVKLQRVVYEDLPLRTY